MRIAITGATGYIGTRLKHHLQKRHEVVPITRSGNNELPPFNLSKPTCLKQILSLINVDYIIHTAAIANRQQCIDHPELAYIVNVESSKIIAEWAYKNKVHLIFLSSLGIYEDNVYANTKRLAEKAIQSTGAISTILRLAYTFGDSPSLSIPKPLKRIEQEARYPGTIKFDDTWHFQPTSLSHLCHVTQEIVKKKIQPKILHIVTKEATTMYEIAKVCISHKINSCTDFKDRPEILIKDLLLSELKLPECTISSFFEEVSNTEC